MEAGDSSAAPSRKLSTAGYFFHPYAALACLLVISALIMFGFYKPRIKPVAAVPAPAQAAKAAPKPVPAAPVQPQEVVEQTAEEPEAAATVESPAPEPGAGMARPGRERRMQERMDRPGPKGRKGRRESEPVAGASEYEKLVKDDLAKCDQLVSKFNDLSSKAKGPNGARDLNGVLEEFRGLLQQMRAIKPPAGFERAQSTLANSVALTRRGLRSKMLYVTTGEATQLSKGQEDLDAARKQRDQGLDLLSSGKQGTASAQTPPPPAAAPPPPASPAVAPATPASPPPAEVETPPEPEPEAGATSGDQPEGGNPEEPPANPDEQPPPEQ